VRERQRGGLAGLDQRRAAGRIEVETRPGEFTEISVTLPRAVIAVSEVGKRA